MINITNSNIANIIIGNSPIKRAYIGSTLVLEKNSPILPYDSEIQYLQSSGNPYIDLGRKINSATDEVSVTFMLLAKEAHTYGIFGARSNSSTKNFAIIHNALNIYADVTTSGTATRLTYAGALNTKYTVNISKSYKSVSSNGEILKENTTPGVDFTTASNALLFHIANSSYRNSKRIYSLTWKRSSNIIMDLIPVRKDGVGYMYDKVSGNLFGNAGTGDFVLGPDVT